MNNIMLKYGLNVYTEVEKDITNIPNITQKANLSLFLNEYFIKANILKRYMDKPIIPSSTSVSMNML